MGKNTLYQTYQDRTETIYAVKDLSYTVILSEDIQYYEEPGGKNNPSYVIAAGTEIKWFDPESLEGSMVKYIHNKGY